MTATMRPELLAIAPGRIKRLPVDPVRGVPVPFFVAWVGGRPEFRAADDAKLARCLTGRLCWVCGEPLRQRFEAFTIGPMCSVNRVSAEPPGHYECAEFSVRACPFLAKPHMVRREGDLPEGAAEPGGVMLRHNPGAVLIWMTRWHRVLPAGGGVLFDLGEPFEVSWWTEGRAATRAEAEAALARGLPKLRAVCRDEGERAELDRQLARAVTYLPGPAGEVWRG